MSKHNHTYNGCKHSFEFCAHCDVVYCTKCGKEWYADKPWNKLPWEKLDKYWDDNKYKVPYKIGDNLNPIYLAANNREGGTHTHGES